MALQSILTSLSLGILLFLLLWWLMGRLAYIKLPQSNEAFCKTLCRTRIILSLILGILLGLFLCLCYEHLIILLSNGSACLGILILLLFLALLVAAYLAYRMIVCRKWWGRPEAVSSGRISTTFSSSLLTFGNSLYLLAVILAIVVFMMLRDVTAGNAHSPILGTTCSKLIISIIVVFLILLLLRAREILLCNPDIDTKCCDRDLRLLTIILIFLLLAIIGLIKKCGDDLTGKYDLAMIGINWEGKYTGEAGNHLRWAFRYGMTFPEQGFNLYRRKNGTSSWELLNTAGKIHPVNVWDGPVPGPQPVWRGRGIERLHADTYARFIGANVENFQLLQEYLNYPPYALLYYVHGRDQPFTVESDLTAYLATLPETTDAPAQWELEPMTLLMTMGLHSEVARLLGLYYIDQDIEAGQLYDYKIVGYWNDRERAYVVSSLGAATTSPLDAPTFELATVIPANTRALPAGGFWPTEASVALRWEPTTASPEIDLTQADGIKPVFFLPERRSLGPVDTPPDTGNEFEQLTEPIETGDFTVIAPIAVTPQELEDGTQQWPDYFAFDNWVQYHNYEYRIRGIDLFGRESTPSNVKAVAVRDTTGPPPPNNIEAYIYQRPDPFVQDKMLPALRDTLFPAGSTHQYAIKVSWLWPDMLDERYPDLKEFHIHYKFSGYDVFSQPANQALWPVASNWSGPLGLPISKTAGSSTLPNRYEDPENPGNFIVPPSRYYETIITDIPAAVIAEIEANDDRPMVYGFISVVAKDHDPFNNVGKVAAPRVVFTRDFIKPDPPAAPLFLQVSNELDKSGNANLEVRVQNADHRYQYHFYRVRDRQLLGLPAPTEPLPASCILDTDASNQSLQVHAGNNVTLYSQVSSVPAKPDNLGAAGWAADLTDIVDGTISQRFFYAARAIDRAGNVSDFSCPSIAIESLDRMPPRAPVVAKAVGDEGGIKLTWAENKEADLERYKVFRTTDKDRLNSKRKMTLVLLADAAGQSVDSSISTTNASAKMVAADKYYDWTDITAKPGHTYYYRIVAEDIAKNASEMSSSTSARAIDTIPPAPPNWTATEPVAWVPEGVRLHWQDIPGESNTKFVLQRKLDTSPAWRSITQWETWTTTYLDRSATAGKIYRYRIRAMDETGNRGDWSSEQVTP